MKLSTERFGDRVANYVKYRPNYPREVAEFMMGELGLPTGSLIADIASGTGKFTELLLDGGYEVVAVEPNDEMRIAAEELLGADPLLRSVNGTAEATNLPTQSVDAITVAQAFHWFDAARAREEFIRILKPGGAVLLIWNDRLTDGSPFLREYEAMLVEQLPEYKEVGHKHYDSERLREFFSPGAMREAHFPNRQEFDLEGLAGRLLSSSYAATSGPAHDALMVRVGALFTTHAADGKVAFEYSTRIFYGSLD